MRRTYAATPQFCGRKWQRDIEKFAPPKHCAMSHGC
jgi:hypothetical protein